MTLDAPTFASPPRTVTVEVWSDVACPWCWIGKRRFATALRAFPHRDHVEVVWRSYQLSPETPTGPGRPEIDALVAAKGLPRDRVEEMFARVAAVGAADGLHYDFDATLAFNTFDAHRLLHLAREAGGAPLVDATMETLFSAHFEEGADLGAPGALGAIARQAGFAVHGWDDARVAAALQGDAAADDVRDDLATARTLGVTGVPFFVVDRRYAVSGAQPAEVFSQLLDAGWREANPLVVAPAGEVCTDGSC
ncbi:DsbA family oxidoreductase [Cellulomonas sp. zg-ZUI199]|uniref:DsbA family oxidoreductase n=1 Tax=Cellulomonas wangleii TaxID=2816956 RepID=A0ABX8D8N2_9CELL|nr:DsbA family oxidoreductase [Cellulomonas wangleii]MBO0925658.1 DsbA family oxidoreductase [Cellulomonas wangleii]QVI63804.1 DsbA family oxidoreductase [Cellulomonas wangleii]